MLWRRISLLICLHVICGQCASVSLYINIDIKDDMIKNSPRFLDPLDSQMSTSYKPNYDTRGITYPKDDRRVPSVHEYHPTVRTTTLPPFPVYTVRPMRNGDSNAKFSAKLHHVLSSKFRNRNLIYSPISLQTILAILYFGAEHETAKQLQTGLELPDSSSDLLNQFQSVLSETQMPSNHFKLNFAHKIYFKKNLVLQYNVRDTVKAYFFSDVAPLSFDEPVSAANEINTWVAQNTHNRITDIVSPGSFDAETEAVLVNAVYLKAKWAREFSTSDTLKQDFFVGNQKQAISVDMMYLEDDFKFGEFPELDAQIVELPFLDTALSMMIILPNKKDGLAAVESQLKDINLNELLGKMKDTPITIRMPKFKIESDLDMEEPLKELGIRDIFTNNAQLGKLFSKPNSKVSKIQHKAFINVNEGGVEAAASTFVQIVPLSLVPNMVYFTADHPFMFAIRSPQAVYFIGHVINNFQ